MVGCAGSEMTRCVGAGDAVAGSVGGALGWGARAGGSVKHAASAVEPASVMTNGEAKLRRGERAAMPGHYHRPRSIAAVIRWPGARGRAHHDTWFSVAPEPR